MSRDMPRHELLVNTEEPHRGEIVAAQPAPARWGLKEGPPRFARIPVCLSDYGYDYQDWAHNLPACQWDFASGQIVFPETATRPDGPPPRMPDADRYDLLPCELKRAAMPAKGEQHLIAPIRRGARQAVRCDVIVPYDAVNLPFCLPAVESILNQCYADCTIHLIGDAVSAADDQPLRAELRGERSVRWYRTRRNLGPYRITNSLWDYLETDYFAVQDSDDLASPNRIWRSVTALQHAGADIFGGAMEQFVEHSRRCQRANDALSRAAYHVAGVHWGIIPHGAVCHGAMTCRRAWFERLNGYAEFDTGADCEFLERSHAAGAKYHFSDQIVAWRRLHGTSLSHDRERRVEPRRRYTMADAKPRFAEWQAPSCDFAAYGALDRYRSGHGITRLREGEW